MGSFYHERFLRLLALGDGPIPGDTVRILDSAQHQPWRGKTGVVRRVQVEVDGEVRDPTPQSLEVIDG